MSVTTQTTEIVGTGANEIFSDPELWELVKDDPITQLLLSGQASTVHEAELKFLSENVEAISQQVLQMVASNLSDQEFRSQPLIKLLLNHGSRRWEDSLL